MFRISAVAVTLALIVTLAACNGGNPEPLNTAADSATSPAALPEGLFLSESPAEPENVKDVKTAVKEGDRVVLVGRIGGSTEPFVADRAIFTLVDRRLKACGEDNPEDTCRTPWDYCCESRETITTNTATVQVVGADGQPIKAELSGVKGLQPNAYVTVVGTVARAEGETFVVNASGFYVEQ